MEVLLLCSFHCNSFFLFAMVYIPLTTMWSDSFGEDIADTNSDDSSEFDSEDGYEDEDDFIDDSDLDMYNPSHVPNSGGRLTFWKTANF